MSLIQSLETEEISKPCMNTWIFHAKVLHAWKQYNSQSGDYLDMVLLDKKEVMIHAICKKSYFAYYLERYCRDGSWIFVTNSSLGALFGGFILTKHVFKLRFNAYTKIPRSPVQQDVVYIHLDEFQTLECILKNQRKVEFTLKDPKFVLHVSNSNWRTFKIEIRFHSTSVHIVQFYFPHKHFIVIEDDEHYEGYVTRDLTERTRLSSWFELNKVNDVTRMFTFGRISTRFIWDNTKKKFYFIARWLNTGSIVLEQVFPFYDL